jgi:hypothetical protein
MRKLVILALVPVAFVAGCRPQAGPAEPTTTPSTVSAPPVTTGPPNGLADASAQEIASAAVSAMTHNYPMRFQGRVRTRSGADVSFDIVRDFADGKGTVTVNGETAELIRLDGDDYTKAGAAFWMLGGPSTPERQAEATRRNATWVRGPLYTPALPVGQYLDLHDNLGEGIINDPQITEGQPTVVDGVPVVTFTSSYVGTVYVTSTGTPNVIRIQSPDGDRIDYSGHGQPVTIEAPSAGDMIDLEAPRGTAG